VRRRLTTIITVCALLCCGAPLTVSFAQETEEEQAIERENDTIKINWPEMDLESVLKNFSGITKRSFILKEMPKGEVRTIGPIGPVEVPREQAFNLFVLILNINGYSVVPTSVDNVYKVVRNTEALRENIDVYPPGRIPAYNENMVTRFIPLDHVDVTEVSQHLGQLVSKDGGQVIPYGPTNTLIVVDTPVNIKKMMKILKLIDVPSPEPEIEIVTLKFAEPSEIAGILGQIFTGEQKTAAARTATTRAAKPLPRRRQPPQPPPQPQAVAGPEIQPKIIPVERINGLVLIADSETIEAMLDLIARLDVDAGATGTIHVYYVQNAEATELASTLSSITGNAARTGGGISAPAPAQPGAPPAGARRTRPRAARTGGASSGPASSGVIGEDIYISADEATNSLIIVATPHDYAILENVIKKLDIPRRQVFVEAVLLEVTYNESMEAGVSLHGASPLGDEGVIFSGSGFSDVSSLGLLSGLLSGGGSLALPNGITVGALGAPVEIPGSGGEVVIPSAGMVVRLLASSSNVNVLSTPTLLTTDNEEASIEVGQKIPVPTGQTVSTGGFSNVSISRETVGIKLQLTPQINESDNIRLNIFTEISNAVTSNLGIDVNQLGVTTSLKTAQTTVIVKDAQTIVIGGLMEDRQEESSSRIPFLGDIPVLGWLFKSGRQSSSKTNLIILLTPHIVRSDSEIKRVRGRLIEGYRDMVEEGVGELDRDIEQYFESRFLEEEPEGPVIDLREGAPEMIQGPPPEWEWTPPVPQAGDTAAPPEEQQAPAPQEGATAQPTGGG